VVWGTKSMTGYSVIWGTSGVAASSVVWGTLKSVNQASVAVNGEW